MHSGVIGCRPCLKWTHTHTHVLWSWLLFPRLEKGHKRKGDELNFACWKKSDAHEAIRGTKGVSWTPFKITNEKKGSFLDVIHSWDCTYPDACRDLIRKHWPWSCTMDTDNIEAAHSTPHHMHAMSHDSHKYSCSHYLSFNVRSHQQCLHLPSWSSCAYSLE